MSSFLRLTVAATALLAATVTGCSHQDSRSTAPDHPTSPRGAPDQATVGRSTTIKLGSNVGPVALSDRYVYFPSSTSKDGDWDRVTSVRLTGGDGRTVARTQFTRGLINWVAASDDGWVYYVDQSRKQSDASPRVLWRIIGIDPATGRKRELASNGDTPDAFVPIVRAQHGWVFWTSAEADRTAREHLWKPGWTTPRDVLRHTEMTPGSESISGDQLVYLGAAATGTKKHTTGGDCWTVPLAGGSPRPLTRSALATGCAADDGWVVWSQHIGPDDAVPENDGILDDPFTLLAQHDGDAPITLHQGYFSLASLYVSSGAAIWQNPEGFRVVQDLEHPKEYQVLTAGGTTQSAAVDGSNLVVTHRRASHVLADVIELKTS